MRYICGGDLHPDYDTICTFRRNNGLEKVELEWDIVTLAYNFKRLFNITGGIHLSKNGVLKAVNG